MIRYVPVLQVAFTSNVNRPMTCLTGSVLRLFLSFILCNIFAPNNYRMMGRACIFVRTFRSMLNICCGHNCFSQNATKVSGDIYYDIFREINICKVVFIEIGGTIG